MHSTKHATYSTKTKMHPGVVGLGLRRDGSMYTHRVLSSTCLPVDRSRLHPISYIDHCWCVRLFVSSELTAPPAHVGEIELVFVSLDEVNLGRVEKRVPVLHLLCPPMANREAARDGG